MDFILLFSSLCTINVGWQAFSEIYWNIACLSLPWSPVSSNNIPFQSLKRLELYKCVLCFYSFLGVNNNTLPFSNCYPPTLYYQITALAGRSTCFFFLFLQTPMALSLFIWSCFIYLILSYLILSYLILSYLISSNLITPHLILSYLSYFFYIILSHIISSHIIYLILSHLRL